MKAKYFLLTLLAFCLCLHLLRFPHLILENGGGAFLILFFLILNVFALPMLVVEKVIDNKLKQIDIRSLISIRKNSPLGLVDRFFISSWFGLRVVVLLCFLWFFLFIGSSCLVYLYYFIRNSLDWSTPVTDIPSLPELQFSLLSPALWVLLSFIVFFRFYRNFMWLFSRWVLPICYGILFVLFLKIIILVNNYEGLKLLFYPDFLALTSDSLIATIGQALACLFIGFGFYNRLFIPEESIDNIEIFVRAIMLATLVAIVVGVMAVPMIEQVSESPFGSNWIFQILPRWLSYGYFGNYYCGLFFLSLSLLSFFVSVVLHAIVSENIKLLYKIRKNTLGPRILNSVFLVGNMGMVLFLQHQLQGWSGQSLLISIDRIVIQWLLPLFALMMVWVLFRYTKKGERMAVFDQQQIFFHSQIFYSIWEKVTLVAVPSLILLAWALSLCL